MPIDVKNLKSGAITLSSEDVLCLLEDTSTEALMNVTQKIAINYSSNVMKESDTQAAEQIFRLLLRDTEISVRAALSEQVKSSKTLPRDIAISLAHDVEIVAIPILEHSQALTESDLIELIHATQDNNRYLAITRRDHVPSSVSDTLIARGSDEVATSLIHNTGADISERGMNRIVERFPENKPLMSALVSRPHLPATVAEKLISHVSTSLAKTLKDKHNLPDQDIEKEVEKTRESETLKLIRVTHDPQEIAQLTTQLMASGRLTPSIILSGLSQGNFIFFETALAKLSAIAVSNARALISDRGDLGFRAIYNKSGLPESLFPAVRLLLQAVRSLNTEGEHPGSSRYTNRVVERLINYAETTPVENLSYMIALVRRTT